MSSDRVSTVPAEHAAGVLRALGREGVRLSIEQELQAELLGAAEILLRIKREADGVERAAAELMHVLYGEGLRLTADRSPAVMQAVEEATALLGLEDVELEVFVSGALDSKASVARIGESRYVMVLHPDLLELCSLEELRFVIGHELGHVAYGHFDLKKMEVDGIPSRLSIKLFEHARLSEVSADRAGLLCCGSFEAAYSALRVVVAGTRSPLIRPDFPAEYAQIEKLRALLQERQHLLETKRSHPYSVLRIGALKALEEELKDIADSDDPEDAVAEADERVAALLAIMSPKTSDDESWLLVLAAFWVACADGSFDVSERKEVAKLCADKEFSELFELCRKSDDAAAMMEEMFVSTLGEKTLSMPRRAMFVERLVAVARADGVIDDTERAAINRVCALIGLDGSFARVLMK